MKYDLKEKWMFFVLLSIFILFSILVSLGGYFSYLDFQNNFRIHAERQISAVSHLKADELVDWRMERLADANFIYENKTFSTLAARYLKDPQDEDALRQINDLLSNFYTPYRYDCIRLLDLNGVTAHSFPKEVPPLSSMVKQRLPDALQSQKITIVDFYRSDQDQRVYLTFLIPILNDEQVIGFVTLRIDPRNYLYPYINQISIESETAETLLVRRDGDDVLFLNDLRFQKNTALNLRFSLENTEILAVQALLGKTGIIEGLDYRGVPSIADVQPVPDSPWFLISKIDTDEVYAPLRERMWQIAQLIAAAIFVLGASLVLIWRQQSLRFYRAQFESAQTLRENEERYRAVFENSQDAIMLTLPDGSILDVNPTAVQMFGLTAEEIKRAGRSGITDLTDPRFTAALEERARTGKVHTEIAMIRGDGSKFPAEINSTLFADAQGQIRSSTTIRDITQRKQAEELLRQQSEQLGLLYEASQKLNRTLELKEIYQVICDFMSIIAPNDGLIISAFDHDTQLITCNAYWLGDTWMDVSSFPSIPLEAEGKGTQSIAIRTGQSMLINDYQAQVKTAQTTYIVDSETNEINKEIPPDEEVTRSALIVPLKVAGVVSGAIQVLSYRLNAYNEDQLKMLESLALHIASAQQNALLYAQVQSELNERIQTEKSLRDSEENMKKAQHYAHVGSWAWHIKTNQLQWSDEMYRIFGIDKTSFTGELADVIARAIHPDDREKVDNANQSVAIEGKAVPLEYRVVWEDGTIRVVWAEAGEMIFDEDGSPALLFGIVQDITERKQAEEHNHTQIVALEAAANGIVITNKKGIIEWVNPAFTTLTGYSKEEVIGKNPSILNSGRQSVEFYRNLWSTILSGKVWHGELVNKRKDGVLYTEEEIIAPVMSEQGVIKNFIAIKQDITERKHFEDTLSRTNLRLQSLRMIDHALLSASVEGGAADIEALRHLAALVPCGKINIIALDETSNLARIIARVVDDNLSVSRVNEPVLITDLRLNEIHVDEIWVAALTAERLNLFEERLYNTGGRSFVKAPLIVQGKLIGLLVLSSLDPGFFTTEYLEIIKDVSAQLALSLHHENLLNEIRRYAEQLEKRVQDRTAEIEFTRQRLELAVNAGEIGVWEINFKENKVLWDERMHLIHGTTPDDFDGSIDAWWKLIYPQDVAQSEKRFQEAWQTGLFIDEHRILCPNGSLRYVSANAIVLYDAAHTPERMIGVNVDVTSSKEIEDTLQRANLEMERALRIKDEFLANMSHELRTPLNAIMGISESLLEQNIGALNEKQQKYISTINESGVHLLSLINDILDLSKIEAGHMELIVTDVSVMSLFESSFRLVKEMAHKKNIEIAFEADERAQSLRGDARRLMQMLVNLLSNAIKFTPEGGKAGVEVALPPELNEIKITIWDTGIGIAEEDMPRLFQSFVQLDSNLSREYSGTGLGLMLVMQMARMHGGNISVQSKVNEGSRFTISLPWAQAQQVLGGKEEAEKTESARPPREPREGTILLVEDTESITMFVDDYLQALGYRVLIARDGLSGILMTKNEHPDLILLDIQMPGIDGFEVVEKIRADASLKDTPIIAMTALAMPGDRERCLTAGMNDYISKPIHLRELVQMIDQYL